MRACLLGQPQQEYYAVDTVLWEERRLVVCFRQRSVNLRFR